MDTRQPQLALAQALKQEPSSSRATTDAGLFGPSGNVDDRRTPYGALPDTLAFACNFLVT